MNAFGASLRRISPALLDTNCFSCTTRITRCPSLLFSQPKLSFSSDVDNKDLKVNPYFINRNPRNLEFLGIAEKREGWQFQYPPKNYYHKLILKITNRNIHAYVEHCTGKRVVMASTSEEAIMKHLYSTTDLSAAENLGRIVAKRCLEAGITQVYAYLDDHMISRSKKAAIFYKTIDECGVELTEPERVVKEYEQGTDYDKLNME